ncbi:MAG: phosphatase PAP2 family protein [Chloroflexi bacterium]|nr:phosphatase PAP2 family protein [Chloroflexota bacterium]
MNEAALDLVNGLAGRWAPLDAAGRFGAQDLLFVLGALLAVAGIVELRRDRSRAITIGACAALAVAMSLGLAMALRYLFPEQRPWIGDADTRLLIAHSADSSFPSDHATVAFAAAMVGALAWPKWAPWVLGMAAAIAIARVFVGVHYPGDVLAGMVLGIGSALVAWFAVAAVERRMGRPMLANA